MTGGTDFDVDAGSGRLWYGTATMLKGLISPQKELERYGDDQKQALQ